MAAALMLFAASARAQGTLTVPGGLVAGASVELAFSDPERAGDTVSVEIECLLWPFTFTDKIEIPLDSSGNGSAPWTVLLALCARFTVAGAAVVERDITP